ncbi:MAG TPA: response regulator [Terriglobia bacterium]|nr:response regulator [Terriglobia bacterium]
MHSKSGSSFNLEAETDIKRALVVDNSPVARSAIVILLQRNGWEVIGAADGAEALMLASTWHFDLVVMTPEPSKVPGLQLVRMLKGQLLSPAVRVLLLVNEIQCVGEVKKWADAVLVKNDHVEKQLHSKLVHLFGFARPHWAHKLRRHHTHHESSHHFSS